MRAVVYTDTGNHPGTLVAVSNAVMVAAGQPVGWVDFPVTGSPTLAAGDYWLGYWSSNTSAVGYYAVVAGGGWYTPARYSTSADPPVSFGSTADSIQYSLYAKLGPVGSPPPPPPPPPDTFGKTLVGGLTHTLGGNYLEVSGRFTLASAASVTKLTGYLRGGGSATSLRAVVYADAGNHPGALVAVSAR